MKKKQGTVIVMEDSVALRNLLSFVLEIAGYRVIPVMNENELIKHLNFSDAAILITVLSPEKKEKLELIRKLKNSSGYSYLHVIAISSHEGLLTKGRDAGATDWLMMPFTPLQLVETVQKVLG